MKNIPELIAEGTITVDPPPPPNTAALGGGGGTVRHYSRTWYKGRNRRVGVKSGTRPVGCLEFGTQVVKAVTTKSRSLVRGLGEYL